MIRNPLMIEAGFCAWDEACESGFWLGKGEREGKTFPGRGSTLDWPPKRGL